MRGLVVALLFLLLGIASPHSTIGAEDVTSIAIDSSWYGLGTPSHSHVTIERRGNAFFRSDGTRIDASLVEDVIVAALGAHPSRVSSENAGLTAETLRAYMPSAEAYLQGTKSDRAVRAAFDAVFTDPAKVQTWLSDESHTYHTDDQPSLNVEITTKRGKISISSQSYHLLMLPFTVQAGGATATSYDARIAYAVAGLMAEETTGKQRLEQRWLVAMWAQDVARMPAVAQAKNNGDSRARLSKVARTFGMSIVTYNTDDGINWDGELALIDAPRLHAEILCLPQMYHESDATCVQAAWDRVAALKNVPWVMRALAEQPNGYIVVTYGNTIGRTTLDDWSSLGSSPAATKYVFDHQNPIVFIRMYPGTNDTSIRLPYSYWLLFADGTMALQEYGSTLRGFPFGDKSYDALFPHASNHLGMMQFVGMLIRRDGTWVKDGSSPRPSPSR